MIKEKRYSDLIEISFYIFITSYWFRFTLFFKKLSFVRKPAEAVNLMRETNLYFMKVVENFVIHKNLNLNLVLSFIQSISIPFILITILWLNLRKREINLLYYLTYLFPSVFLFVLSLIFAFSGTLDMGVFYLHLVSNIYIVIGLILLVVSCNCFYKKVYKRLNVQTN